MSEWEGRKTPVSKETKSSVQHIVIPEGTKPVCTATQLADAQVEVRALREEKRAWNKAVEIWRKMPTFELSYEFAELMDALSEQEEK